LRSTLERSSLDQKLAGRVENKAVHCSVKQPKAMHLGPALLSCNDVVFIDYVKIFLFFVGNHMSRNYVSP